MPDRIVIHYQEISQTTTICGRRWPAGNRTANQYKVTCARCRTALGLAGPLFEPLFAQAGEDGPA